LDLAGVERVGFSRNSAVNNVPHHIVSIQGGMEGLLDDDDVHGVWDR